MKKHLRRIVQRTYIYYVNLIKNPKSQNLASLDYCITINLLIMNYCIHGHFDSYLFTNLHSAEH